MLRQLGFVLILVLFTAMAACSGDSGGGAAEGVSSGTVEYSVPSGWIKEQPRSSMRQGQYRLPKAGGDAEDAEMAVFHWPGQGGSVQANVDRWIGQFTKPDGTPASDIAQISERQVNGESVTIVDVSGIYASTMGGPMSPAVAKANYRMLAAIINTSAGPWFFKLTGPANTVSHWESSFDEFAQSLRVR